MFKKLFFLAVIATCLVALIWTAETFVLEGSPGMALYQTVVLLGVGISKKLLIRATLQTFSLASNYFSKIDAFNLS